MGEMADGARYLRPLNSEGSVRGRFVTAYEDKNSLLTAMIKVKPVLRYLGDRCHPNTLFTFGADTQRTLTRGGMFGGLPCLTALVGGQIMPNPPPPHRIGHPPKPELKRCLAVCNTILITAGILKAPLPLITISCAKT